MSLDLHNGLAKELCLSLEGRNSVNGGSVGILKVVMKVMMAS